jgi:excisionase family DNA binding protein
MEDSASQQNPNSIESPFTLKEVAQMMKVSERHIQNLVKRHEFPNPFQLGRSIRFRPSDIRFFLNGENDQGLNNQAI